MKTRRIWFHVMAIALLLPFGGVMTAPGAASAQDDRRTAPGAESAHDDREDQDHFRGRHDLIRGQWDFVRAVPGTLTAERGGTATASAEDGSKIILTGGGTFNLPSGRVTGGGTWQTQNAAGAITGSGRYRVRSFVQWDFAPGAITCPPFGDNVGDCEDIRGGHLVLTVDYLDGTEGVLTISCHLLEAPDSVFEGMHATKSFVDYWRHAVRTGEDSNTLFHIRSIRR